jgi:hypothetical protein
MMLLNTPYWENLRLENWGIPFMNDLLFLPDNDWAAGASEEECIAQEIISCYNCRFRRFVENGIVCTQKGGRK